MKTSTLLSRLFLILLAVAAAVVAGILTCGGDKGTNPPPPGNKPDITAFQVADTDIMPGDSTLLNYTITGADSAVLNPGGKLDDAAAGSLYLKPALPTKYTLRAYNKSGQDSASVNITMLGAVPNITSFTLNEDTILVGDSIVVSWATERADSLVLQGVGKLTPVAAGSRKLAPTLNTLYRTIAYNPYGADTATTQVRVEVPASVQAVGGQYYKGTMGSSSLSPQLRFRVIDNAAFPLRKVWMHFAVADGDGILSADSLLADASGSAQVTYGFTGSASQATVRAFVPGIDTTDVSIRASAIRTGADGQGQYVLLTDTLGVVTLLNGLPASFDPDPNYWINYANYEAALGLVVMIEDVDQNDETSNGEPVVGVIMNTVYAGKGPGDWGVGSLITDVIAQYGPASSVEFDPAPPAAYKYQWATEGLTIFTTTESAETSRTIFEIHVYEVASTAGPAKVPKRTGLMQKN